MTIACFSNNYFYQLRRISVIGFHMNNGTYIKVIHEIKNKIQFTYKVQPNYLRNF